MKFDTNEIHTRTVNATLDHDDVVSVLGLAVKLKAGIPSDQAGATADIKLVPGDDGTVSAEVHIVIDLMPPKPQVEVAPSTPAPIVIAPAVTSTLPVAGLSVPAAPITVPSA